jgi:hypothetical protein
VAILNVKRHILGAGPVVLTSAMPRNAWTNCELTSVWCEN